MIQSISHSWTSQPSNSSTARKVLLLASSWFPLKSIPVVIFPYSSQFRCASLHSSFYKQNISPFPTTTLSSRPFSFPLSRSSPTRCLSRISSHFSSFLPFWWSILFFLSFVFDFWFAQDLTCVKISFYNFLIVFSQLKNFKLYRILR